MQKIAIIAAALAGLAITSAFAQTATPPAAPATASPAAASSMPGAPSAQDPAAKARFEKFRAVCGADIQKACGTVDRTSDAGRGQMRQCIETNKAKFSADCQAAVAERDANRAANKTVAPANAEKPKS